MNIPLYSLLSMAWFSNVNFFLFSNVNFFGTYDLVFESGEIDCSFSTKLYIQLNIKNKKNNICIMKSYFLTFWEKMTNLDVLN